MGPLGEEVGVMRDDPAEILFQSFLPGAIVSSSGMGRDVHVLMLCNVHPDFLSQPWSPPSNVPCKMVVERLSWLVTCLKHASFRLFIVARRGSCGPTRKLILLYIQCLVLCSKLEKFPYF